jgi:hypothetical protein
MGQVPRFGFATLSRLPIMQENSLWFKHSQLATLTYALLHSYRETPIEQTEHPQVRIIVGRECVPPCCTPVFCMVIDYFWPVPDPTMGNTSSSGVQKCLEGALGKDVAFKSDPLFQLSHVKPYNLGISSTPAAVTYPKSSEQIGKIVKCAVDNSLKVQPRCGGHSYANYGMFIVSAVSKRGRYLLP